MTGKALLSVLTILAIAGVVILTGFSRAFATTENHSVIQQGKTEPTDGPAYSKSGYDITQLTKGEIDALADAKNLTAAERRVILASGTEPAFCGDLTDNKKDGTYVCRLCDLPLFGSDSKFTSGTGWPSFFQPVDVQHMAYKEDSTLGMSRMEILCSRCGGHLGHVFPDGPAPTRLRYCVNSVSLDFVEEGSEFPAGGKPVVAEIAYFAGGCFWGIEDHFQQIPGVIDAVSGYQGGDPSVTDYKAVCSGKTGHAESVRITYDPKRVSYRDLLGWFFKLHDPTTLNRQGPDRGTQYRSAIFAANDEQLEEANAFIKDLSSTERFKKKSIVTHVSAMAPFFEAEEYHQDYHAKHGGSCPLPPLD